jgi:hypothetical protein
MAFDQQLDFGTDRLADRPHAIDRHLLVATAYVRAVRIWKRIPLQRRKSERDRLHSGKNQVLAADVHQACLNV